MADFSGVGGGAESLSSEDVIWRARPSIRPLALLFPVAALVSWFAYDQSVVALQTFIDSTYGVFSWTQTGAEKIWTLMRALCLSPLAVWAWVLLKRRMTVYELTSARLLYHHGVIVRRHDQIWLQRVRDFRVFRPLLSRLLGTGTVRLISRDESWPVIDLGAFVDPLGVESMIRRQVSETQEKTGFREFEAH